jgi:hypothetical protein
VTGEEVSPSAGAWKIEGGSAIENVAIGMDAIPNVDAFLVIPADSPLLQAADLMHFQREIEAKWNGNKKWIAVGLAEAHEFREQYPTVPNNPSRFKEGEFGAGALYACSRHAFAHAKPKLAELREFRKRPWRIVAQVGILTLAKFALGKLSLREVGDLARKIFESDQAIIITTCHSRTLLDFDNVAEYEAVSQLF